MSLRSKINIAVVALVLALGVYGFVHASTTTQFSYSTESFLNQSGNMAATTLFTPAVDGNYQVTVNVEFVSPCCGISDGNNVAPTLTWSDNTRSLSVVPNGYSASTTNYQAPTVNMHVKAGTPVQISAAWNNSGGTANDAYNVFVTVIGN